MRPDSPFVFIGLVPISFRSLFPKILPRCQSEAIETIDDYREPVDATIERRVVATALCRRDFGAPAERSGANDIKERLDGARRLQFRHMHKIRVESDNKR